jgi:hypothetical protein
MTREEIDQLIPLIPWDAPYLQQLPPARESFLVSRRHSLVHAYVDAFLDPRFGWKFVRTFAELGQSLPRTLTDERFRLLWRAYQFETENAHDPLLLQTLALDHPRNFFARNLVKAFLVAPDLPWAEMSQKLGMPIHLLQAYDQLFFNVRDRLQDEVYIQGLIYPEGRRIELMPDYLRREQMGLLLLRAVRNHGIETAMTLGGFRNGFLSEFNSTETAQRLESMIMGNGALWARLGGLNQSHMPGIMHARAVIAATKQGGQQAATNDDTIMGLGAVGSNTTMGESIMTTMLGCQSDSLEQRLARSPLEILQDIKHRVNTEVHRAERGCRLKLAKAA